MKKEIKFEDYHKYRVKCLKKRINQQMLKDEEITRENLAVYYFSDGFYEGFKFAGGKCEELE